MTDNDDLRNIQHLIKECAPTLLIQTEGGVYPYEVGQQLKAPDKFSTSTNAMVAHSVACVGGLLLNSKLVGFQLLSDREGIINESLHQRVRAAVVKIVQHVKSPKGSESPFSSTAFGVDDPFTIGWLLELLQAARTWNLDCRKKDLDDVLNAVYAAARERVIAVLEHPNEPVLSFPEERSGRAVLHPLPLLRIVQIADLLESIQNEPFEAGLRDTFDWFLNQIHLQLSRRNIQHSGFDITELVFCLEGLLASRHGRVTSSILNSVVSALKDSRQLNPTLRATTPFKVNSVGAVHLFTSIEVVASLLRSAASLKHLDQTDFFTALKPTLVDYLSWLQATMLRGETSFPDAGKQGTDPYPDDTPLKFAGWHSEHAHTADNTVHIWLTSQILLFLRSYETLLSADIASQALEATGLRPEVPGSDNRSSEERSRSAYQEDPLQLANDSPYRIVSRLEEFFVEPHRNGLLDAASYSCLLYGPPGTGKTTLARRVAYELGWPLLTITTSDFIIDGEAQVEARAKRIFEALELQSNIVIFFDEIDRLLLDRDTSDYLHQGDMLQFMTPSMLTKINNLRRTERSIFIIGTNYADRIDSAIKRAGRIDSKFLVLPPDLSRRAQLLRDELKRLRLSDLPPSDEITAAAVAGAGRTIAELKSAARDYTRKGGRLSDHVTAVSPAVTLSTYRRRFESSHTEGTHITEGPHKELLEEAYLLAYLLTEGHNNPFPKEHRWFLDNWVAVRNQRIIKDETVSAKLDELFTRPS